MLAYFAGLPLAFVWIATVGPLGVVTVLLKDATGFNLSDHFDFASIAGIGLAYFYFQIPLMVIFISPALEGCGPSGTRRRATSAPAASSSFVSSRSRSWRRR